MHVSAETSRRLACDASRVVMRYDDEGRLLEVGARTRTIPPALRRALHARDRGCRFPGCDGRFTPGASSPSLGARRPDHALEPRPALPPPSPCSSRGGLSGRSRPRWHAPIPTARWSASARGAAAGHSTRRSSASPPDDAHRAGPPPSRTHDLSGLAGGTPGCGLGDRRPSPVGHRARRSATSRTVDGRDLHHRREDADPVMWYRRKCFDRGPGEPGPQAVGERVNCSTTWSRWTPRSR
jgi:hypothetical protein